MNGYEPPLDVRNCQRVTTAAGYLVLGFAFQVVTMALLRISRLCRWRNAEKIIYLRPGHGENVGKTVETWGVHREKLVFKYIFKQQNPPKGFQGFQFCSLETVSGHIESPKDTESV
jgi:hypothetical protein